MVFHIPLGYNILINVCALISFYLGIKLQVIGLTGGIACGKTTVSNILKENGYTIIDCDQISKDLRNNDEGYKKLLIKTFGQEIDDNGQINSEKLGQIVFSDPKKRAQLNKLTHWRIFREIFLSIFKNKIMLGLSKVVLDAPLLFETKILEHICHPIVCVYISDEEK